MRHSVMCFGGAAGTVSKAIQIRCSGLATSLTAKVRAARIVEDLTGVCKALAIHNPPVIHQNPPICHLSRQAEGESCALMKAQAQ